MNDMKTIVIRPEESSRIRMKMMVGGKRPTHVDWRAICPCGWEDKFDSEGSAQSGAAHHGRKAHGEAYSILRNVQ